MNYDWHGKNETPSVSYRCGYCGQDIASNLGYTAGYTSTNGTTRYVYILICHHCKQPTFIDANKQQYPGATYGDFIDHLPSEILGLYTEARQCMSVNAYTASVLCSRKLLMNIAVSKGASQGLSFQKYVDYLATEGYISREGKEWVDHIRNKGNEATHEIPSMSEEDAKDLITFTAMLLKTIYEFPTKMKLKKQSP